MAQPHQYVGTGAFPAVAGESYEESYQPKPFPSLSNPVVPGNTREASVEVSSRTITDAATKLTITSITHNPLPHVEYGRVGNN